MTMQPLEQKTRALAHVETVKSVSPIENADKIEVATVLGWHCVTKKGEVSAGDLVIYFEIDSFLPVEPRYEFLRQSSFKKMDIDDGDGNLKVVEGFRLKTVKLRGQVSQGLVLPVSDFPDVKGPKEGMDVTDILGIRLYERPIPANMRGAIKGGFPRNIKKTDQERIQNHPEYFEIYKNLDFEITEKVDGTSLTAFIGDDGNLNVCSRNLNLKDGDTVYWNAIKATKIKDVLDGIGKQYVIQGELAGEGINKNPIGIKGQRIFVFNVWDIASARYLLPRERMALLEPFIAKKMIDHVPVIDASAKPFLNCKNIDDLIATASGKSKLNKERNREGIVFKSNDLVGGEQISFKIVDNHMLLKESE